MSKKERKEIYNLMQDDDKQTIAESLMACNKVAKQYSESLGNYFLNEAMLVLKKPRKTSSKTLRNVVKNEEVVLPPLQPIENTKEEKKKDKKGDKKKGKK